MKIQLTTNFGQANGVVAHQWFNTLGDAQDYCELVIKSHMPAQSHKSLIEDLQDCNVKGLTNLMTGLIKFHFEWID